MRRLLPAALVLVFLVAACTQQTPADGSSPSPDETTTPTTAPSPEETSTAEASPEPEPVLEDGRHIVFIVSIKTGTDPMRIRFDLAEMLTGEEANEAAVEDGVIAPGEPVPNDYYIRNENPKLRKLPIADAAKVKIVNWDDCCDSIAGDLDQVAEAFATGATDGLYRSISPFWITVKDGVVVKLEEQYLP